MRHSIREEKTLQNSISHDPKLGIDKDMVAAVLEEMGLSATVRGEALSLAQFARDLRIVCSVINRGMSA